MKKRTHHVRRPLLSSPSLRKSISVATGSVSLLLLFVIVFTFAGADDAVTSPEVKFTDRTSGALQIVPASGESDPGTSCPVGTTRTLMGTSCTYSESGSTCTDIYECVTNAPAPDLTGDTVTVNGALFTGGSLTFTAAVVNIGNAGAGPFDNIVQVDEGNNGSGNVTLVTGSLSGGLGVGPSAALTSEPWSPITEGTHSVRICADLPPYWNGRVVESSELNNCGPSTVFTVTTPHPDLTAGTPAVHGTLEVGSTIYFSGPISNIGDKNVTGTFNSSFQVDINSNGWDSWYYSTSSRAGLNAGGSFTTTSKDWKDIPEGTHKVRLCADLPPFWKGQVKEENEGNNCGAEVAFTVTSDGTSDFDLRVNGSKTPDPVPSGQTFYFTWTSQDVRNCTPLMVSSVDSWWTNGAGVSVGGFLPTAYGNPASYASTGLGHSLIAGGTYTYMAQCESTVALAEPPLMSRLGLIPVAEAATLYSSVPVTITVCDPGEAVVNGKCEGCSVNQGNACGVANACGARGTIQCDGSCLMPSAVSCPVLCDDDEFYCGTGTNAGNLMLRRHGTAPACLVTDMVYEICAAGCRLGACVPVIDPGVTITAKPTLVRNGGISVISWTAVDVNNCTITGGKDLWQCFGGECAAMSQNSKPIKEKTAYTISCEVDDAPNIVEQAWVDIIPEFIER